MSVTSPGRVRVFRGGVVESTHAFHAVAIQKGSVRLSIGNHRRWTFYRSASKPFQALPLVEDRVLEGLGFDQEELALACGSHSAEGAHLRVARRMLERLGVSEERLACGGHWPFQEAAALRFLQEGRRPGPVDSNCSGKHMGMLALARHHGWPLEGYQKPEHPVQRRMRSLTGHWSGLDPAHLREGIDGCGVVCFAVPLEDMAASFARLADDARRGGAGREVCEAMTRHPFLVAGTDRLCTDLMRAEPEIVAKVGAEGVYGVAVPRLGLGMAIKVEDGGWRAVDAALVHLLDGLGLLSREARGALQPYREPQVTNTRGERVGWIEVSPGAPPSPEERT
ncbi:MAG: asparaginase [Gemmatimonadota bacterium]